MNNIQTATVNPIYPGGGAPNNFFAITQEVFELGSSNFLTALTNTCPSLKAAGLLYLLPDMPYFTYTWLNLYFDLLQAIGFQYFIAGKPITKATCRLHNFCE